MSPTFLILLTAGSVALLLVLIIVLRLQAFIALLIVSMVAAILGGVPVGEVIDVIREGMGGTLGYIAVVIGVGTMLGEIVQVSGGARQIATTLVSTFGERRAQWALTLIGLIVATPVFFEVALILFIPLVYDLTRKTGKSILYYGIPLVGGIAVAHAFIPPTPGPVAVAALLGADLGWVILFGLIGGIPAAIVGGVLYGSFIGKRIIVGVPEYMEVDVPASEEGVSRRLPSFAMVVSIIGLPLVLILLNTASTVVLPEESTVRMWMSFIGHPFTALTLATLLSFYLLGTRLGFSADEVQRVATRSMEPVGMIILLTGAGGVFGRVLVATGVGDALVDVMAATNLPVVLFGFLIATAVRVSQGSATVAMVTTAGLMAPIVGAGDYSAPLLGAVTIAIACGSTVLSHVNDSGFWLVKQFMGLTEKETLKSWTVMETIIGVVGLVVMLLVSLWL
ncbi:MAG: GntP family permease [Bacteroidota bacterium]